MKWLAMILPAIIRSWSLSPHLTSLFILNQRARFSILSGCNISDITLRFMTIHLKFVESLDLSYCTLISDDGLDALTGNEGELLSDHRRGLRS